MSYAFEIASSRHIAVPASAVDAPLSARNRMKGAQLALGRARCVVKLRRASLADARTAFAHAQRALAEVVRAGLDSTVAHAKRGEASKQVRERERAVSLAEQREDAARTALRSAEMAVFDEREHHGIHRLTLDIMPKAEKILTDLEVFVECEVVPALHAARAACGPGMRSPVVAELSLRCVTYMMRICQSLFQHGQGGEPPSEKTPFSAHLPAPANLTTGER